MKVTRRNERLLTFKSGGWVLVLSAVCTLMVSAWLLGPVLWNRGRPTVGDGKTLESYRFDLRTTLVPREQLTPAVAKDMIRALGPQGLGFVSVAEVPGVRQGQRRKFLVDHDRVIGLVINGEARAYPLRVLALHEIVNDTVGGTPVAVTYGPLTDSSVVFDRRVEGVEVEFGVSGLVLNSNLLLYDRRADHAGESLWSQLLFKAVAGPAAARKLALTRVDFALCDYVTWKAAHPDTRVFTGDPVYRNATRYAKEPYQSYFANDNLKFPVAALWSDKRVARKTPIALLPRAELPGEFEVAPLSSVPLSAAPADRVYAFLFAWYAFHPDAGYGRVAP